MEWIVQSNIVLFTFLGQLHKDGIQFCSSIETLSRLQCASVLGDTWSFVRIVSYRGPSWIYKREEETSPDDFLRDY
jgi:hypothetical protein